VRRSLTVLILVGVLLVLAVSPAMAHGRHHSCDGLTNAATVTHDRNPPGHGVVHDLRLVVGC